MKELSFKISSVTPMLMNNVESMRMASTKPARTKYDSWEQSDEMFESRQYREGTNLVIPARVLKGVLKEGAKGSGIKQKGKRSGYGDLVQSTLFIPESLILDQKFADVTRKESYVGMNGTKKILRVWPKLEEWSGVLNLIVDEQQFDPIILQEILEFAGNFVGVGDYRPEFGRFTVKKV